MKKTARRTVTEIPPPENLSAASRALWAELVPRRAQSPERLELLTTALQARDRAEAARKAVDAEGLTTVTKATGVVRLHPAARVEAEARADFLRVWELLGLARSTAIDGPAWTEAGYSDKSIPT